MKYDPTKHRRRSIRLAGHDYAQGGAYYVTVCAHGRECVFGEVVGGAMRKSSLGEILEAAWERLPQHYGRVVLDAFVVMPNHVHGVLVLTDDPHAGAGFKPAPAKARPRRHALSEIVRGFKTFSARKINALRGTVGARVWQRNYYERVIRNGAELSRVREYVLSNPEGWDRDRENPALLTAAVHLKGHPADDIEMFLKDRGEGM